ncbi:hypothetical protein Rhow_007658 [Rhodococcus wratislaviensis]|uniref:Uncharacterized protein n=1 Tax=Rhodococcus wratislaviensis TaxID=44752 RepID=A0A402CIM3_RHOWR|nr:hypothetical protein Rhow_007658 [Rhodococcus wratislaviensis]
MMHGASPKAQPTGPDHIDSAGARRVALCRWCCVHHHDLSDR